MNHKNLMTEVQRAELFQFFGAFELAGGGCGQLQQHVASVSVNAEVLLVASADICLACDVSLAIKWNDASREVQSAALLVAHNLHYVW